MSFIDQDKIEELIQSVDIVDVISEYVSLQASGKSMKGLCPFHSEKTPSFHVSKDRQLFNCFGCHKKGNVVGFIQEYKHLDYIEAIRYLADQYHFDLGENNQIVQKYNYSKLYDINKTAKDFFNLNLLNLDSGKKALDYLIDRKIDKHTMNDFNIGYAPPRNNILLKNLKENFQEFEMVEAGLIGRSQSGEYYDLFRDRIMFPILNEQGKVLGFSGRILSDDKSQAKYINTQATKIFNKGEILYNLDKAIPFINQRKRAVLMEGFFDVIQAYMAGVEESICTMGTELTVEQAKKIKKYTDNVVICYDGDSAGKQATYRALNILEKAQLNVQVALMPDGLDPDEYINNHSQAMFRNQLNQNLIDKYDFVFEMIIQKGIQSSSEIELAKNALFKFLLASASKTITSIYLQKFSEVVHLPLEAIEQDYKKYLVNQRRFQTIEKEKKPLAIPKISKARTTAEIKLISYYLQSDDYRSLIDDEFHQFHFSKGLRFEIFSTMREMNHQNREVALYNLKSDLSDKAFEEFQDMLLKENYQYSDIELRELIDTLILESLVEEINELKETLTIKLNNKQNDEYYKDKLILDDKRKSYEIIKRRRNDKKANPS